VAAQKVEEAKTSKTIEVSEISLKDLIYSKQIKEPGKVLDR